MKVEDDTGVIPVGEPEHSRDGPPPVDRGPWGTDAVPLGKDNDRRSSTENIRCAASKPRRWIVLAAITCTTGLIAALGVNLIGGESGVQTEKPQTAQTRRQPRADALSADEAETARRTARQRKRVRSGSRQRSVHLPHPMLRAPSPTYAPAPAPQPAPTPEPVAPSPVPAPASTPAQTSKPPPASGPGVAKEFGFER